jgi:hypothetical protein
MALFRRKVTAASVDPSTLPVGSPWTTAELQQIIADDIFGTDAPVNTRALAMRLPVIKRGRRLLCSTISRMPLRQLTGDLVDAEQPAWLTAAAGGQSPQLRIAWTVDDLLFYDWSLWLRLFDRDEMTGVQRIPYGDWKVTDDLKVEVDGQVKSDEQVILIGGFGNGILADGVDVLNDARALYRNVRQRLAAPIPPMELHQEDGEPLSEEQVDSLLTLWRKARLDPDGAVAFTPRFIKANPMAGSDGDAQLMIEGRNASAVDQARLLGISAGMVDATAPKASLNYETQTGRNQEFVDLDVTAHMGPIEARLSLDDICPPGTRIAFDTTATTSPTAPATGPNFQD